MFTNWTDRERFVNQRLRRDAKLRDIGIEPERFREIMREREIANECDTDEYRETQPSKGLSFISEFMRDWTPGIDACYLMFDLTKKWLAAGANMGEAYSGAAEYVPIVELYFDWVWEQGGFSIYSEINELPDNTWIGDEDMSIFGTD